MRLASLLAFAQLSAVAVPNANVGIPGFRFPGILSLASALQLHVQPQFGFLGLSIDLVVLLSLLLDSSADSLLLLPSPSSTIELGFKPVMGSTGLAGGKMPFRTILEACSPSGSTLSTGLLST